MCRLVCASMMDIRKTPSREASLLGFLFYSTSGRPAMLVRNERIPASADALATATQFTSPMTVLVLIVAIAVCATVLIALTELALSHSMVKIFFIRHTPYLLTVVVTIYASANPADFTLAKKFLAFF